MSVSVTSERIDMALGGSWRARVLEYFSDSLVFWFRPNDRGQTSVRDVAGGFHGTLTGSVTQDADPLFAESGGGLDFAAGTTGLLTPGAIPAFSGTLSIVFWFTPQSGGDSQQCIIRDNSGDGVFFAGSADGTNPMKLYVRDASALTNYYVQQVLTAGQTYCIAVQIPAGDIGVYIDGVPVALSPDPAAGTWTSGWQPDAIGNDSGGNSFNGILGDLFAFDGTNISTPQAVALYEAGLWTDVSNDVIGESGVSGQYGIAGNGPTDRIAEAGLLELWLRNDAGGSVGLGGHSPHHVNARSGFTFGTLVRVAYTYSGTEYVRFLGKISNIAPAPGQHELRRTRVVCEDLMALLIDADLRNLTLQTGQTESTLIRTVMEALPSTAQPLGFDRDAGLDTIPYAFHDIGAGQSAIRPAGGLALSSLGYLYIDRFGRLRYENRQARQTSVSQFTFDESMIGLSVPSSLETVYNRIRLTVHPKRIDAAATTVITTVIPAASATNPSTVSVPAGGSITVWADYFDPNDPATPIGATEQVTPVATTDYTGHVNADGTGTNKTAQLTVTPTFFASSVKLVIANADAALVWVTFLRARGKGLYDETPVTVEASSVQPYGDRPISIDLPYYSSTGGAEDLAAYLLKQFENPETQAHSVTFDAQFSHEHMLAALSADIGDRITVAETMTGLFADLFIHSIQWSRNEMMRLQCTFGLSPAIYTGEVWELEAADSELGVNTFLAFA